MNTPAAAPRRFQLAAAAVFAIACWFCLWNLGHASFWHDEAEAALMARALIEQGDIVGWDGRNLYAYKDGAPLNADLRNFYPPLSFFVTAAGFSIFGMNEVGGRAPHAFIGLVALALFYFLLRRQLPRHPRLVFLAFAFAALSAQLILFFRSARYYSTMLLLFVALFYCYEKFWQRKNPAWLAAMTAAAVLSFFNHYVSGAAMTGALAVLHLIYRARETTARQWAQFAACGAVFAACALGYMFWIGVIGAGYDFARGYEYSPPARKLILSYYHLRELFRLDWISWLVFLWLAFMLWRRRKIHADKNEKESVLPAAALRLMVYALLFVATTALLSPQPPSKQDFADHRYYIAALPFLLIMKAMFVNWLWTQRQRLLAAAGAAVMLFSNAAAWPFIFPHHFEDDYSRGVQPHLFKLAEEITRGYEDGQQAAARFLLKHAKQDEFIKASWWPARGVLQYYTGHRLRFCCQLNPQANNPLIPVDIGRALGGYLYEGDITPDWIVNFERPLPANYLWQFGRPHIQETFLPNLYYPTQRPEIYMHAFRPLLVPSGGAGVYIYRLLPQLPPPPSPPLNLSGG